MFHEGQQIGFYTLIKKLDKGGFGEVWLAEKQSEFVTKRVAIKLPHDEQINFDAIRQEANLWEQASGHPNVLPLIDADVYDGQVAIVSEYASGGSLAEKLKTHGKFQVRKAVEMTVGILNGLDYLHSKNIVHRDIKPANVLLQGDTPRLADFGISRAVNASEASSVIVGTEPFMAPEAFEGTRNTRTDIWSVGVVLYKLLTGKMPFPQTQSTEIMYAVLMKEPEALPDEIPARLREIVFKALEKDREPGENPPKRYQTAAAMREDLINFLKTNSNVDTFDEEATRTSQPLVFDRENASKLNVPIITNPNKWRNTGRDFTKRKTAPAVFLSVIVGLIALVLIGFYQFGKSATVDSNVSVDANLSPPNTNSPGKNAAVSAETSLAAVDYFNKGIKFYGQRKFVEAVAAFTSAIELNPADFTFYNNRGLAHYAAKNYDAAILDFDRAVEINPNDSLIYNNRGVAYEDKGEIGQAIVDYRKALELNPNDKIADRNLKKLLR